LVNFYHLLTQLSNLIFGYITTLAIETRVHYPIRMKVNENSRNAIFEVIGNQINANDPVETSNTLKRLMDEGYSEFEAKQYIGKALTVELFYVMKHKPLYYRLLDLQIS
jgi:hypothetical protein